MKNFRSRIKSRGKHGHKRFDHKKNRTKLPKKQSDILFKRTASNPHPKNLGKMPMRGGIRL